MKASICVYKYMYMYVRLSLNYRVHVRHHLISGICDIHVSSSVCKFTLVCVSRYICLVVLLCSANLALYSTAKQIDLARISGEAHTES